MTGTAVNDAPTATNLSAGDLHRRYPAQSSRHRGERCRQRQCHGHLDTFRRRAGSLNTATSGSVTSTYNAGDRRVDGQRRDRGRQHAAGRINVYPGANYNSNFTIATSVDDGVAAPITGTKNMTGTAVNDAPTATNLNAAETYTEDTALNLTDIVVSDVDSAR